MRSKLLTALRMGTVVVVAAACFAAYRAAAAPLNSGVSLPDPDVVELLDEIERWKSTNREGEAAHFDELFAARCYFALGRSATALEKLALAEAGADKFTDTKRRLQTYSQIAELVAGTDPARARRLLAESEKLLAKLTKDKRYPVRDLNFGYFALGDARKAIDTAYAAADAEEHAYAAMKYYEDLGFLLTPRKTPVLLAEVQKRIRELQPREKEVGFTDWLESGRTYALAAAGLPEEAAAHFADQLAARPPTAEDGVDSVTIGYLASSYLYLGRRADTLEYIRQARKLLPPEDHQWLSVTAAKAGDFDLAVALLEHAEHGGPYQLNSLAVLAHRAGKSALRDELLARGRRAYDATPESVKQDEQVDVAGDLAIIEAMLGRFEPLVQLIPQRPETESMRLRALLILAILQKQGRPVFYHGHDMLDAELGLGE